MQDLSPDTTRLLTELKRQQDDIHRVLVGNPEYRQVGLIERLEKNEENDRQALAMLQEIKRTTEGHETRLTALETRRKNRSFIKATAVAATGSGATGITIYFDQLIHLIKSLFEKWTH